MTDDEELYYEGSDLQAMSAARNYTQWIFDSFKPWLSGSVCEVGAGGGVLSQLILSGDTVNSLTICEPSPNLFSVLQDTLAADERVSLHSSTFEAASSASGESYDAVIYDNVLEHIEDDTGELQLVAQSLRPGGHVLILVPALRALYSDFDASIGHYRRYHKADFRRLFEVSELEPVSIRYMDLLGVIPWYISMVLLKGRLNIGAVKLYDRVGVPLTRAIESIVNPPLGKNILAVARRRR